MLIFHGFRKPNAQISGLTPLVLHKRIISRNRIGLAGFVMINVDAQNAREQVRAILAGHLRVRRRGARTVAGRNIKIAVLAEDQATTVMAPRPEREDDLLALGIDHRRIGPAHRESRNDRPVRQVVLAYIAKINIAVFGELWMKHQTIESRQVRMQLARRQTPRQPCRNPARSGTNRSGPSARREKAGSFPVPERARPGIRI